MKLDFKKIYVQDAVDANPLWRARADDTLARFTDGLNKYLPYCPVRYSF